MTASWMLYATCVAVLLAVGTTLIDSATPRRIGATRFIWIAMLACALAWPAAVVIVGGTPPDAPIRARQASTQVVSSAPDAAPATAAPRLTPPVPLPAMLVPSSTVDRIARRVALLTPLLVLATVMMELIRLARARRRWRPELLDGVPVLVSADFGPAVVGLLTLQIVIPAWALALPLEQRALMLAHESEHLARHDNRWLGVAFLAIVLAPWNIGLWWLLNRFRLALEVDCDRRVLLQGHNLERYGNLLIGIGRHDAGRSLLAAGFAERRTTLRARIERMTVVASAPWGTQALRAVVGLAFIVAACSLGPARKVQQRAVVGSAARMELADATPAVSAIVPPAVRRLLDRLTVPVAGAPSISMRFSRDSVDVGESTELVTMVWFPNALREGLRRQPMVTSPLISGLSETSGQPLPIAGGTIVKTGAGDDLYVSWRTIPTTRSGKIEAAPAVLTYLVPGGPTFAPDSQIVIQSLPAILVVRARK